MEERGVERKREEIRERERKSENVIGRDRKIEEERKERGRERMRD